MMMTIALRFIPHPLIEGRPTRLSLPRRPGARTWESGSIIDRAKAMIPILIPLFVSGTKAGAEELGPRHVVPAVTGEGGHHRMEAAPTCAASTLWALAFVVFWLCPEPLITKRPIAQYMF